MKKLILYISILGFIFSSCSKDLDEAAVNRNNPEDVSISEIFPSAQAAVAYTIGNSFAINGGIWAQYWTQGSTARQYLDNEKYSITNSNQNRPWSQLYAGALNDLKLIKSKALTAKDSQMYAMALVMEAYTYQVLADAYENIPMTQALDISINAPTYDNASIVYDGIAAKLVEAQKIFKSTASPKTYAFDLFYAGDMAKWTKLTNTLLLKVYVRQSYARPAVASAGITANLTGASFLSTAADNAMTRYGSTQNQKNPLHASQLTLANFENLKASNTSLNVLNADVDKRIPVLYAKNAGGTYAGFAQGAGTLPTASTANTNFSNIGDKVGGKDPSIGASSPIIFMSNWESMFLQAEAIARGWMGGTAATMYSNGIRESHLYLGLTAADATAIAALHPLTGSAENQAGLIVAQKWVSMNGTQCFEGYTEVRRMNYTLPYVTFPVSAASIYGAGLRPHRFPYPADETATNPNTPVNKLSHVKMWFSK
jgi:Starch-binding associating with outer membrane